eukprot:s8_g51.t1
MTRIPQQVPAQVEQSSSRSSRRALGARGPETYHGSLGTRGSQAYTVGSFGSACARARVRLSLELRFAVATTRESRPKPSILSTR